MNNNLLNITEEERLAAEVTKFEEGFRPAPYYDSLGYPSIGFGTWLGPKGTPLSYYTIRISQTVGEGMVLGYCQEYVDILSVRFAEAWKLCNPARRAILMSMFHQLGGAGITNFKNMWKAILVQDWNKASAEMKDSTWYKQTTNRAERHMAVMRSGTIAPTYNL